jgi:hypothetical protein
LGPLGGSRAKIYSETEQSGTVREFGLAEKMP